MSRSTESSSGTSPQGLPSSRRAESRGSVLIFVVGVLLLLAIVATAFLGTSRSDRTATQQNAFNTQIDLLMEGVVNAATGRITGDESVAGRATGALKEMFDAPIVDLTNTANASNDDWLASRVPVTADSNESYQPGATQNTPGSAQLIAQSYFEFATLGPGATNPAIWPAVTSAVIGESKFESPYRASGYNGSLEYTARTRLIPTFLNFGGQTWPAFEIDTADPNERLPNSGIATIARYQPFLAADADGDGVADSGLFRIPVGQLSGVTYFGAVRIVDNNAAVNINTAQSRDYDFDGAGAAFLPAAQGAAGSFYQDSYSSGAFTSNVGLYELLRSYSMTPATVATYGPADYDKFYNTTGGVNEFQQSSQYRLGTLTTPVRPGGVGASTGADMFPYDDTVGVAATRGDFQFLSIGEQLSSQLGRRGANPGRTTSNPLVSTAKSAFVDSLTLASRFCLSGTTEFNSASPTTSEGALARRLYLSLNYVPNGGGYPGDIARSRPYTSSEATGGIDYWFGQNFNALREDPNNPYTFMNRRSLLTGINGVSEQDATTLLATAPTILLPSWAYLFTYQPAGGVVPQWSNDGGVFTGPSGFVGKRDINAYAPHTDTPASATFVPTLPMSITSATTVVAGQQVTVDPKVSINTGRFEELFYAYFKTMAQPVFTGTADDRGSPFSTLYSGDVDMRLNAIGAQGAVAARAGTAVNNTAAVGVNSSPYYADPYIGSRFTTGINTGGFAPRVEPGTQLSVINGNNSASAPVPAVEQHPLRMFRSPLRAPPNARPSTTVPLPAATAVFDNSTPRLPADQVVVLRAAIAAANLEALRDSSFSNTPALIHSDGNDRIVEHRIPLTAMIGNGPVPVVARVFGLKRQPYIVEVYANTMNQIDVDPMSVPPPAVPAPDLNPKGYVAIKLYNPYSVPISLQYCKLVGLRRLVDPLVTTTSTPPPALPDLPSALQYPDMQVLKRTDTMSAVDTIDQIDLGTARSNMAGVPTYLPYVIPANGTLVLENVDGTNLTGATIVTAGLTKDATHRPQSSMLTPNVGPIDPISNPAINPATMNFAYVPGLQQIVWDREVVLMRPMNAVSPSAVPPAGMPANTLIYTTPVPVVPVAPDVSPTPKSVSSSAPNQTYVPLDSFDFTGLNVPDLTVPVRTRAQAWHYARQFSAAGPEAWKFVYPGRYDANQSIANAEGCPRQQGTYQAFSPTDNNLGWPPGPGAGANRDPWAETAPGGIPATTPPFVVGLGVAPATPTLATYGAPNLSVFTCQLNATDWPSANRLHDPTGVLGVNRWPYGGFRRLGDMLQAPFIGSYIIQKEEYVVSGRDIFLEIQPVTMDAAMADDTDPADDEKTTPLDDGTQSREQIGRFVPLRPSIGTTAGGRVNGEAAMFTRNPDATIPVNLRDVSTKYDTAFDTVHSGATVDPLRYSDDEPDVQSSLPNATVLTPAQRAAQAQTNRYQWASKLFDHFTIDSPHDDYLPSYPTQPKWQPGMDYRIGDTVQFGQHVYVCRAVHTSTTDAPPTSELNPGTQTSVGYVSPGAPTANWYPLPRTPVSNAGAVAGNRSNVAITGGGTRSIDYLKTDDANETSIARPGVINLNTAPERVLSMLPWFPRVSTAATDQLFFNFTFYPGNPGGTAMVTIGSDGIDDNVQIAHLIALYRDGNYYNWNGVGANDVGIGVGPSIGPRFPFARAGVPFKSIYDLYKVPGFRAVQDALLAVPGTVPMPGGPGNLAGDYSPLAPVGGPSTNDGARYDFEEQTLMANRVSNLVTCQSDVFTLYALVQGWRNLGTANPELVVQRRAAFIIDRSGLTATNGTAISTRVPVR